MGGIFKGIAVALALLAVTSGRADAFSIPPPPVATAENMALYNWPKLAQRDGKSLLVMNHGGGTFSTAAAVFTDGAGDCQTYRFSGVQMLFDGYTRRREPVADLVCQTVDGPQHALVRQNGSLLNGRKLTASADGHYVFIEGRHAWSEDDHGNPVDLGLAASVAKWTIGANGGGGPFVVSCRQSRPDGPSDFRARCMDAAGNSFDARIAGTTPDKPDDGYKRWRIYDLSAPSDNKTYLSPVQMISTWNIPDPFVSAANEARAITEHPGLVRRDGPDLVLLDNGKDARHMRDDGCEYWYSGRSIALYDARAGTKRPVAEINCQRGEFDLIVLAPPYAPPQFAYQGYAASDDGKTLMIGYGSTDIIDWQSRKVLLSYPHRCGEMTVRGSDHFSCNTEDGAIDKGVVDFDCTDGVWTVTERPKQ